MGPRSGVTAPPDPAIGAILFDLDNTLLDRDAGFRRFCQELYHASGVMGRTHTEEGAVALLLELDADGQRSRRDLFAEVIRLWPGVFKDVEQAMRVYLTSYPRLLVLDPLTRELLEELEDRGIPRAIVTNGGSVMQMNKVRESGLAGMVQAVVISEEVGAAKPDRRIFERALAELRSDPSRAMFVGDNPDTDILGAKGLGIRTVWVHGGRQWPYSDQHPDHVVGHVSEVRRVLFG